MLSLSALMNCGTHSLSIALRLIVHVQLSELLSLGIDRHCSKSVVFCSGSPEGKPPVAGLNFEADL